MNPIPQSAQRWQKPFEINDTDPHELKALDEAPTGSRIALTFLHIVNTNDSTRVDVDILSMGDSDTVIGPTAAGLADGGAVINASAENALWAADGEALGIQLSAAVAVRGWACGYIW